MPTEHPWQHIVLPRSQRHEEWKHLPLPSQNTYIFSTDIIKWALIRQMVASTHGERCPPLPALRLPRFPGDLCRRATVLPAPPPLPIPERHYKFIDRGSCFLKEVPISPLKEIAKISDILGPEAGLRPYFRKSAPGFFPARSSAQTD